MDDAKKQRISEAALVVATANRTLRVLAQINVPEDFEKAKKQAVELALAQAEAYEAQQSLNEAIRS